jgi:hypothetical protein
LEKIVAERRAAAYFRDGSAATLIEVINFDEQRFGLGLSDRQNRNWPLFYQRFKFSARRAGTHSNPSDIVSRQVFSADGRRARIAFKQSCNFIDILGNLNGGDNDAEMGNFRSCRLSGCRVLG